MIPIVLTVAGSDSSGGAGIQADLRTFARLNVYGASVITALTAQNANHVQGVMEVPPDFVAKQWDAVMTEFRVDAVKTGMLANSETVEIVAAKIQQYEVRRSVVDPVMISSSGRPLLNLGGVKALKQRLAPLAFLMTPNLDEARTLTGVAVHNQASMEEAAKRIHGLGTRWVLVKGGHLSGGDSLDVLFDGSVFRYFHEPRIEGRGVHGTGCVLSAAIAAHLALGKSVEDAVQAGKDFVTDYIRRGQS
jgi:hydroxymethylpyrimidine kinase/phosphomethylpyrimidine kinase